MSLCWKRLQSDLDSQSEHQEPPPSLQSCQYLTLFCTSDPAVWVDMTLTPGLCSTAPTGIHCYNLDYDSKPGAATAAVLQSDRQISASIAHCSLCKISCSVHDMNSKSECAAVS